MIPPYRRLTITSIWGFWLSQNLTWTRHIKETCKSASRKLGVICRKFYHHSSHDTLKQLYLSLIRSKLEYAAPVWDSQYTSLCHKLENVQKFTLRICTKNWSSDYEYLLNITNLPALSVRREYLYRNVSSLQRCIREYKRAI